MGGSRFFQEMDSLEHYMTLNLMVLQTQIKLNKLMKLATMGEILSLDYVCICQRKGISNSILIITSPTQNLAEIEDGWTLGSWHHKTRQNAWMQTKIREIIKKGELRIL